jgi:branched-chain amino acid transport system substrate-binding protein
MKAVRNMNYPSPILLPGIEVKTSASDGYPIEAMQVEQFNGRNWELVGDVVQAQH